jgi:putative ABC transport system permease protein
MNCGYEYFEAMNIPVVKGRNFHRDYNDNKTTYIINETAAKEFGWKDPIGQRISGPLGTDRDEGEVIGVVKDFHYASLHSKIEPLIIFLVTEGWGIRYVYVKLNPVHPRDVLSQIENEYRKSYSDLPFDWEFLDVRYSNLYQKDYEIGYVFQVGLVISILVSCLGIFSMSALLLMMRAKEMGIRKVVGATQLQLVILHIRSFIKFIVIAVLIAWPVIFYLSRNWLDNFAYHIDLNMWYFIFPGLITLLIILLTSGFHSIKSARVNPVDILKHE